jgi:uncharacterized protein
MPRRSFSAFDWDEGNRDKCQKHGLSITEIEYVLSHAETLITPDPEHSFGEQRLLAIGRTAEGRPTFVVFTLREGARGLKLRPISARHMHQKEIEKYEKEIARAQKR